jgi:7,8-dihydropterin-6-yl-methyl-4-(beta-D-ribofuranosyl)aminobenzene 5'-phosphate synthase
MKVTVLFDNMPQAVNQLVRGFGFAALVETTPAHRILFDTGGDGSILLKNMETLGIDPGSIHEVFISHAHNDHTGGLLSFIEKNKMVKIWAPPSFTQSIDAREIAFLSKPTRMYDGVYSTGELEGIEQSLVVETVKGLVIIAGCSHPAMQRILAAASSFGEVYGIIGGLHSTRPESLKGLGLICATHCTKHIARIKQLYPHAYIKGGAGRVINV